MLRNEIQIELILFTTVLYDTISFSTYLCQLAAAQWNIFYSKTLKTM